MRIIVMLLLVSGPVFAREKRPPRAPRPAPVVKSAAASPVLPSDPVAALNALRALYAGLEYDQVISLTEGLLTRENLTIAQRLEAYQLLGSAKAIVEDPSDAEKPFRLLLRARTDYELPADTAPKILAVFRKVQSEEKALAGQLREVERARLISNLSLLGDLPPQVPGGHPVTLAFRLKDPTGAVETVKVPYRRSGQRGFSALALERSELGDWRGQIPAEFTASEAGFQLEYWIETADHQGVLLTLGTEQAPRVVAVLPGLVPVPARPKPLPAWLFWSGVGLTGTAAATAGGLGLALSKSQSDYRALVSSSEVDAARVTAQARQGQSLATATNAVLISAGIALVASAVMLPFTRFGNE